MLPGKTWDGPENIPRCTPLLQATEVPKTTQLGKKKVFPDITNAAQLGPQATTEDDAAHLTIATTIRTTSPSTHKPKLSMKIT